MIPFVGVRIGWSTMELSLTDEIVSHYHQQHEHGFHTIFLILFYLPIKIFVYRRYLKELNSIYKRNRNLVFLVICRIAVGLIFSSIFSLVGLVEWKLLLPKYLQLETVLNGFIPMIFLLLISHPISWFLFMRLFFADQNFYSKQTLRSIARGTVFSLLTDLTMVVQFLIYGTIFPLGGHGF